MENPNEVSPSRPRQGWTPSKRRPRIYYTAHRESSALPPNARTVRDVYGHVLLTGSMRGGAMHTVRVQFNAGGGGGWVHTRTGSTERFPWVVKFKHLERDPDAPDCWEWLDNFATYREAMTCARGALATLCGGNTPVTP